MFCTIRHGLVRSRAFSSTQVAALDAHNSVPGFVAAHHGPGDRTWAAVVAERDVLRVIRELSDVNWVGHTEDLPTLDLSKAITRK